MPREPVIEFINFSYQYRTQKNPTLFDIDLCIYAGERVLIAGPSGSGKSTLGCCVNGLVLFNNRGRMTGGLKICGKAPESVFDLSGKVGTVLQDTDAQFTGLTSGGDIAFALENRAVPLAEMRRRVNEAAGLVGATGYLDHSPYRLSGGQKQRVGMAGVLVDNAPVLLMDEPLASLDPLTGKTAMELIDDVARQTGCTVIIIEHRIEDAMWRALDRVVLLDGGRIVADGTPDEIVLSPKLKEIGVREPLYVSALTAAGVILTEANKPGSLHTLTLTENDRAKVRAWAAAGKEGDANFTHKIDDGKPVVSAPPEINPQPDPKNSQITINESPASKPPPEPGPLIEIKSPALKSLPLNHPPDQPPLLEVKNVSFTYAENNVAALKDVSFKLFPGEMTAIVGENGAGKSTLAKVICGFEKAGAGELYFGGESMADLTIPERAEKIGFCMQNPNQMLCQPFVYDEVALGLRARGVGEDEVKERVGRALDVCALSRFVKWPVSALSYGEKKRVTIADALVLNPRVVILDEPTAGQDWRRYTDIMDFLARLNDNGYTVLMITHDMHLCLEYARRALVFAGGALIADLPAYELLSDPELAKSAHLKETSLYALSGLCGIPDARDTVRAYLLRMRLNISLISHPQPTF